MLSYILNDWNGFFVSLVKIMTLFPPFLSKQVFQLVITHFEVCYILSLQLMYFQCFIFLLAIMVFLVSIHNVNIALKISLFWVINSWSGGGGVVVFVSGVLLVCFLKQGPLLWNFTRARLSTPWIFCGASIWLFYSFNERYFNLAPVLFFFICWLLSLLIHVFLTNFV